ncbi:SEC-C metal-binding domain-containing protein [Chloroflexota bacterium]
MVKGRNSAVLSVRLPDDLADSVKSSAKRNGITVAKYIENAIRTWRGTKGQGVVAVPENEVKTKSMGRVEGRKIGRNDYCPCGSGKKYKKCCGN